MAKFSHAIYRTPLFSANLLYLIHNYTYIHYIYIYKYNNIIRIIRLGLWGNSFLIFLKIHIIFFTSLYGPNVGFLSIHFYCLIFLFKRFVFRIAILFLGQRPCTLSPKAIRGFILAPPHTHINIYIYTCNSKLRII